MERRSVPSSDCTFWGYTVRGALVFHQSISLLAILFETLINSISQGERSWENYPVPPIVKSQDYI